MLIWLGIMSAVIAYEQDLVWELNKDNYESALAYQSRMLTFFYNSECKQCQTINLELKSAAETLNDEAIRVARVNCDSEGDICARYGVTAFPHFWYFIDGQPLAYNGPLLATGISKWVLIRQKLIYRALDAKDDLAELIQKARMTLVFFGEISDEIRTILQQVSLNYNYIQFFETKHEHHLHALGEMQGLVLFKGESVIQFQEQIDETHIKAWLDQHKPSRIYEFNDESIKLIFENQSPTIFFFRNEGEKKNYQKIIEKLSDSFSEKLIFVTTDLSHKGKNANKLANALGISPQEQPIVVILDFKGGFNKYRTKNTNYEDLFGFIQEYFENKLQPYYKSQSIDKEFTSDEKLIRVIVGNNHEEFVKDVNKDVLMLYCTEKHPNCTDFYKVYEKIAIVYTQYSDFSVGTMDIVYNEAKGLVIPDIPLIILYPKENKQGLVFKGDLSMISVLRFITDKLPTRKQEL